MSVFDTGQASAAGLQNAASVVANSLVPRRHTVPGATSDAVKAHSSASTSADGSTTGEATITSTDFLTLLVAELQNQDPTQPTDPNAYIQQLVGVNSLQQLISIDQGITTISSGLNPVTGSAQAGPVTNVQATQPQKLASTVTLPPGPRPSPFTDGTNLIRGETHHAIFFYPTNWPAGGFDRTQYHRQ